MIREKIIAFFTLFGSTGTLLCCALPATLAALAGGTAVVSLLSLFPWLITLSQHKGWLFLIAGLFLAISGLFTFKPQSKLVCAVNGGTACATASGFSRIMFYISLAIYFTGFFFSYLLVPLLRLFE